MKKVYTKFPLALLTLLNYAPYTHAEKTKLNTIKRMDEAVNNETSAPQLIDSLVNAEIDTQALVNEFINAEIPENFDLFFNRYFPAETINNSEKQIYSLLSQLPLSPSIQNSTSPFETEEFAKQLPTTLELKENYIVEITCADENYKGTIPFAFLTTLGCSKIFKASINPEHNILFLHFENNQLPNLSCIGLINIKTLVSMVIPCIPENEIKQIGLLSDCSQLGIMRTDDTISSYTLPTDLIDFSPSLKQRAFTAYVDAQINMLGQKIAQESVNSNNTNDVIKTYSKLPLDVVHKLALLIHTHKDILPESLYKAIYSEKVNSLEQMLIVSINAKFVADTLNIDIDTLVDQIASNEITQEQILAILSPEQSSVDDQSINA